MEISLYIIGLNAIYPIVACKGVGSFTNLHIMTTALSLFIDSAQLINPSNDEATFVQNTRTHF